MVLRGWQFLLAIFYVSSFAMNAVTSNVANDNPETAFRMINGSISRRRDIGCLVYMEVSDHSVVGVFIQVDEKFAVVTLASALLSKINYTMLDEIDVLFGAYNLKNEQESHRELSKVRRFVVHPNYRPGEHSFDIAVIFLKNIPTQNMEIRSESVNDICTLRHVSEENGSPNDRKLIKTMGVKISTNHPVASGERGHVIYASRTEGGRLVEEQDEGAPLLCRHLTFHNVFAGIVHIPPSPQEIAITSVYDNADWLRHIIRCR